MNINFDYFNWLQTKVKIPKNHSKLAHYLSSNDFYYFEDDKIRNDVNRYHDGLDLRYTFSVEDGYELHIREEDCSDSNECSLLEFFVALAEKFSFNAGEDELSVSSAFREMMTNLGIWQNDREFDYKFVESKIKNMLDRKYGIHGKGSIFPLKSAHINAQKSEIWVQMREYINENYPY